MVDFKNIAYRSMVSDYRRIERGLNHDMTGNVYKIDYLDKMTKEFEARDQSHRCPIVMGMRGRIELGIK